MIRVDASDKVRGAAKYVDDLDIPGCWHGFIVRSPVPHGKLVSLEYDETFDWSRVVVATAADIPGTNVLVMHDRTMPLLAFDEVLYLGEPLAVVAAPTLELAREASSRIKPIIEKLPDVQTLREVVEQFKTNSSDLVILSSKNIVKGDVEKGFAEAAQVVEREYWAGHQEQLYLEPQGLVAIPEKDGSVLVQGSMQCPYYVQHELHEALGLPPEKLRVKQSVVGGAFGGKEEFPSMLAGYCALPAMKAGRPVKILYDRNQDILFSTKRHPCWVRHRTGLSADGQITAMQVDYLLDGGAYLTISDVVMYRGILHAAMGYRCENVLVKGVVARTHSFPCGAFRGFGAPQAIWALESHIDELAVASNSSPHEFRLRNCLRLGDSTSTGQVLRDSVGSPAVLEDALRRSDFAGKLAKCSSGRGDGEAWCGVGLSFFAHGAGFTGDGESKIGARVALVLDLLNGLVPGVIVRISSTEMGQGMCTVMTQIAADGVSIDCSRVDCPLPDTALVPNSGPTVASRTTMIVGSTVFGAAREIRERLESFAARAFFDGVDANLDAGVFRCGRKTMTFDEVAVAFLRQEGALRVERVFALPPEVKWDQESFKGDAYPSYSWGCNVAEVEVSKRTLEIKVRRVTACFDIGRVINPLLARGQVEGGLTQALGYAVMEKLGVKNGRYDADRLQTYIIPTMLDVPEYDLSFVEFPYEHAAPGAKGVGEMPMNGLAPAIANAVAAATGVRLYQLPMTPESLFEAMKKVRPH